MVTIKGTIAWFWPILLLTLLSLLGPGVESIIVFSLIVVQILVVVYKLGQMKGKIKGLQSNT
jgi:hypothetical protein